MSEAKKIDLYNRALERNLAELSNGHLKRMALIGMSKLNSSHALDFFQITAHALKNDMLSHLMKVFDVHNEATAFRWCFENAGIDFKNKHQSSVNEIDKITLRLKNIRDKTHFHIDKKKVSNPSEVWSEAKINGDEIECLFENGFLILSELYKMRTGNRIKFPEYDGSDAPKIIRAYKKCHPNVSIMIPYNDDELDLKAGSL